MKKLLFFAFLWCSSVVQAVTVYNINLTEPQKAYLESLTKIMRLKSYALCDLCNKDKNHALQYKNQSERDYDFQLTKLKGDIEKLINEILALYKEIGVNPQKIEEQRKELHAGLCCYDK